MRRLKLPNLTLEPDRKIVRADEYSAYVDAQAIIAAAREEAERIRIDAQAEYERQKQKGYEDGLFDGQQMIAEKMLDTVEKAVDYLSGLETKVVEIVLKALRKILGEVNQQDVIVQVVRNAMAVARTQPQVTLRTCPEEADTVRERLGEILAGYPGISNVDVVADKRLQRGGCILETEMGVVDASVEVQLEAIRSSLLRSLKKS